VHKSHKYFSIFVVLHYILYAVLIDYTHDITDFYFFRAGPGGTDAENFSFWLTIQYSIASESSLQSCNMVLVHKWQLLRLRMRTSPG